MFFFLPKHHSFAQLNVPNASRWSVLIPKCVLSVACSFDLPDATKVLYILFWKSRPLWKKTWENMMFFRALHASFVQETKRFWVAIVVRTLMHHSWIIDSIASKAIDKFICNLLPASRIMLGSCESNPYTLTSASIFSILFYIHFLWYWQEFFKQLKLLSLGIISFILMLLMNGEAVLL